MLIVGNKRSIALQTAECTDIPNEQFFEIDETEWSKIEFFEKKYGAIKRRTNPTAIYNCHGLTFASRRTHIGDEGCLQGILSDDKYKQINYSEVLGGDIILYFDNYGINHSGIVLEENSLMPNNPKICSKWGGNAEYIHFAMNSPYGTSYKFYRLSR